MSGCSTDNARNHYVLAEKLWADRKYAAAVSEFEKVTSKDPHGKLGLQAKYRAAMTQFLFLSQYGDAVRKFSEYAREIQDPKSAWDAQLQIGEILFSKTEQYDQAIIHYRSLLRQRPQAQESPELLFRIGRSHFFLFQFNEAVAAYEDLIKLFPGSSWAEKAMFEVGATYFTRGEQGSEGNKGGTESYRTAMAAYQKFIHHYPKSNRVPEAQFGIASCLEEMDQLSEAYKAFSALKGTYPSPHVIDIKLSRIRQRTAQRNSYR
jgi:TolA-binding protein